ncbi:MAG TPA: divergent polysaccharide deacetylase family protein [Thermoanaerobaculia bacterium]|nr:divergent polysaccharide deacetylase family protein [Thermoanaerobaculia bacterium]
MSGREEWTRSSSFKTIAFLVAIPLFGMAVFFLWQWWNDGITPEQVVREVRQTVPGRKSASAASPREPEVLQQEALPRVTRKARKHRGDIVLIIDDLGFEGQPLGALMKLDPNINCAILPNGTHAEEFATRLHAAGFEILCHLPMQPQGGEAPGRNAILTSMSDDEIARLTRENIEAIPHARGVNNHMGSLATSDRRVMTSVMRSIPEGMYFIDSRTSGGSVAANVAREMNVRTATRNIFLDDLATERGVRKQLAELANAAEKRGIAIGIGHPHAVTMRVLAEEIPELRARGFRFVRASEVVR